MRTGQEDIHVKRGIDGRTRKTKGQRPSKHKIRYVRYCLFESKPGQGKEGEKRVSGRREG